MDDGLSRGLSRDLKIAQRHAPLIRFDTLEPFLPVAVGVSVLRSNGRSPSFRRDLTVPVGGAAIEYALYWDWDIQHLYDLEHIWIYLDARSSVIDAEASFHGRYLKALLPDGSNTADGRLVLYSQPGKHAFSPLPVLFELLPDYRAAVGEAAGKAGVLITDILEGRTSKTDADDAAAEAWLRGKSFAPSGEWRDWRMDAGLLRPWTELDQEIPARVEARLAELRVGRS